MNKKGRIIATGLLYIVMVIVATTEGLINMFGVSLKETFNVNDTTFSLMFTFGSIGYLTFNYVGGYLSEKIGQKKLILIGLVGLGITNIIQAIAPNFLVFTISFAIVEGFLGLISIAVNTIIPILWITGQAVAMNLTHFAYGVGLSSSQKLSGILLNDGMGWRKIYIGAAIMTFVIFILFLFINLPNKEKEFETEKVSLIEVLKDKTTCFLILGLGFYIMGEQGTGRWLPSYIEANYQDLNKSQVASYISLFFLLLTIGRLVGGFIVQKIGTIKTVKLFSLISTVLFTIGLSFGKSGLYIISISGFFFSIILPTIIVIANNNFKKNKAYATGVVITFACLVNTVLNLLVGFISDLFGISVAIYIMPLALFITFISITITKRLEK